MLFLWKGSGSMLKLPKKYKNKLSLLETEVAVKKLKDYFEHRLAEKLQLIRVSAPIFVLSETGINDNLNGVEDPVQFYVLDHEKAEIVHSLAKWKRFSLGSYHFEPGSGLYTDMNAIRKDEEIDNIHSYYVDQWDWEKIIKKEERTMDKLVEVVKQIYEVFLDTAEFITKEYPMLKIDLPEKLTFISSQELEDQYPDLTPKEREAVLVREKKAVFITQIGGKLKSGKKHDGRSPDYDDWNLNGDLIFYNPILDDALELSSMGIRVDRESLLSQLEETNNLDRLGNPYHEMVANDQLPYTIGGGIGQSRLCMFFLNKAHIGEVQVSVWDKEDIKLCQEHGIHLL